MYHQLCWVRPSATLLSTRVLCNTLLLVHYPVRASRPDRIAKPTTLKICTIARPSQQKGPTSTEAQRNSPWYLGSSSPYQVLRGIQTCALCVGMRMRVPFVDRVCMVPRHKPIVFSMLPILQRKQWTFVAEVYNFRNDPKDVGANIVLSIDESSYTGESIRLRISITLIRLQIVM
jgi:hypothetical protein